MKDPYSLLECVDESESSPFIMCGEYMTWKEVVDNLNTLYEKDTIASEEIRRLKEKNSILKKEVKIWKRKDLS